ncbi:putative transmembrane protein [Apostichopus japonicus]|uniref:Putative transmembrane protein n=1 Tax=Stichopus japonicus TaxID=307972 RepID=A0A2G8K3Z2_STIJA|nr:putative transmembrane protein [Apostichopus japonicus]
MATTLKISPFVIENIDRVLKSKEAPEGLKRELRSHRNDAVSKKCVSLPYHVVKEVYDFTQSSADSTKEEKLYFHEFLEGCEIYFPPQKEPERNPELLARLERLKREQDNKQYNEMTNNVQQEVAGKHAFEGFGREVRSVKKQLMGMLNFILTLLVPSLLDTWRILAGQSIPTRVMIGLFLTLITAAADLYFIVKTEV